MLLAGDVGGTKTTLALFDERAADLPAAREGERAVHLTPTREITLQSREFPAFEDTIRRFLAPREPHRVQNAEAISAACFGVAGPVVDGRCVTTNLPWELDERQLAASIPAKRVRLLNDLEAMGHGVLVLPPAALVMLQPGRARSGSKVLIAAGTGLGEALLSWDGDHHTVIGSEGGHADFAPRDDTEIELLRYLMKEFGHVSYERVLSGPGLLNIYRFLRDTGHAPEPAWLAARMSAGDPSAVVSEVALAGGHPLCVRALELFVSIYGAEAGNLALKAFAVGGVYIGGGIGPKIRPKLEDGRFAAAFCDKGRFAELMASIPVHLVLEPRAALLGAAHVARSLI
jgi:glucokinase